MDNKLLTLLDLELAYHVVRSSGARLPDDWHLATTDYDAVRSEMRELTLFYSSRIDKDLRFRDIPVLPEVHQEPGVIHMRWGDIHLNWKSGGTTDMLQEMVKAAIAGLNDTFQNARPGFASGGYIHGEEAIRPAKALSIHTAPEAIRPGSFPRPAG